MNLTQLLYREIKHRWKTSLILVALVATISGAVTFFVVNNRGYQKEVTRNARDIGSNVVILPVDVDQVAYHMAGGYSETTMPYAVVDQLIEFRASLNHLIPMLERKTTIAAGSASTQARLVGISASIPVPGRPKAPMQRAIEDGRVQLGSQVAKELGIDRDRPGEVTIYDQSFPVARVNRETGTWQDAAVLIDLSSAQHLLGLPDRISRIEAVECTSEECARTGLEPAAVLSAELNRITAGATLLRREAIADARSRIRQLSDDNLSLLQNVLWAVLVLSIAGLAAWNAIQRSSEIGVLQAVGFGSTRLTALLVGRTFVLTLLGLLIGQAAGVLLGYSSGKQLFVETANKFAVNWGAISVVAIVAMVLAVLATSLPAIIFANRQPADLIGKGN